MKIRVRYALGAVNIIRDASLYMTGLMAVIYLEQNVNWLSIPLGGARLYLLGANYYAVVRAVTIAKHYNFHKEAVGEIPKGTFLKKYAKSSGVLKMRFFVTGLATIAFEFCLNYVGPCPERNLLIGGIAFLLLSMVMNNVQNRMIFNILEQAGLIRKAKMRSNDNNNR